MPVRLVEHQSEWPVYFKVSGQYIMHNMCKNYISFNTDGKWLYARYFDIEDAMFIEFQKQEDNTYVL